MNLLRPLLLGACALLLLAAPAAAQLPQDVQRVERAVTTLYDAKRAAAGEVAANRRAARRALRRCHERGPGWERIRAVGDRSQHDAYVRGARRLWSDLSGAAHDRAALTAYRPAFDAFLARFEPPLDDPVLRDGVAALRSRLAYEDAATEFATCATFERLLKPVREFRGGVSADFQAGGIYQRMVRFVPDRRRAAVRRHFPSARVRALDAAKTRLIELGGDMGRAIYFRYAYSLKG